MSPTAAEPDDAPAEAGDRAVGAAHGRPAPEVTDRVRGLAVHRRPCPGAPRVVLVHGAMDRGASFIRASRRLANREIVRYDRRGYGRSIEAPVAADLAVQVEDLAAIIGPTPSVVIGHSLGGVIALMAAERYPDRVRAVGAFEAPMPWLAWWPGSSAGGDAVRLSEQQGNEAAAERFMRRIIGDDRWDGLPAGTRLARRSEGTALMADLRAMRAGFVPYAFGAIHVPVVAGRSRASDEQHRRAADTLAAEVDGAELFVIDGADHGAHNSDPAAFAAFIERTVARAEGAAPPGR